MSKRRQREGRIDAQLRHIERTASALVASGNPGLAQCGRDIIDRIERERRRVAFERDVWRRLNAKHPIFQRIGGRP